MCVHAGSSSPSPSQQSAACSSAYTQAGYSCSCGAPMSSGSSCSPQGCAGGYSGSASGSALCTNGAYTGRLLHRLLSGWSVGGLQLLFLCVCPAGASAAALTLLFFCLQLLLAALPPPPLATSPTALPAYPRAHPAAPLSAPLASSAPPADP